MPDKTVVSLADLAVSFPDYDLDLIAKRVDQIERVKRFSQRAEAIRLQPVIACLVQTNPHLTTAEIASILIESARANADKLGPTFEREVGSQIRAAKADTLKSQGAAAKSRRVKPPLMSLRQNGGGTRHGESLHRATPPVANIAPTPSTAPPPTAASPPTTANIGEADEQRPYRYTGTFAGIVFKHTGPLRQFYSAVQRHAEMSSITSLAHAVLADQASLDALPNLKPVDRAIFDAVASAISGGLL